MIEFCNLLALELFRTIFEERYLWHNVLIRWLFLQIVGVSCGIWCQNYSKLWTLRMLPSFYSFVFAPFLRRLTLQLLIYYDDDFVYPFLSYPRWSPLQFHHISKLIVPINWLKLNSTYLFKSSFLSLSNALTTL